MNTVNLVGKLVKDPELHYSPKALAKTSILLSVDSKNLLKKAPNLIMCIACGDIAEEIAEGFDEGSRIGVVGELQAGYIKVNGKNFYKMQVFVESVTKIDSEEETREIKEKRKRAGIGVVSDTSGAFGVSGPTQENSKSVQNTESSTIQNNSNTPIRDSKPTQAPPQAISQREGKPQGNLLKNLSYGMRKKPE